MNKSYQPVDHSQVVLYRVVYTIFGFDQEFSDVVMALGPTHAVEVSFNHRESKHPEINWDHMYAKHGADMGTAVKRIEEFRSNMTHFTW
jgi:hypothetical protein